MNITLDDIRSKAPEGARYYLVTIYGDVVYGDIRENGELWCYYPSESKWKFPVAQNTIKSMLKPLN